MVAAGHGPRPKRRLRFCCLGLPLSFDHNLIILHTQQEHPCKLGGPPAYLVGSEDTCEGFVTCPLRGRVKGEGCAEALRQVGGRRAPAVSSLQGGLRGVGDGGGSPCMTLWSVQCAPSYLLSPVRDRHPRNLVFHNHFIGHETEAPGGKCPSEPREGQSLGDKPGTQS